MNRTRKHSVPAPAPDAGSDTLWPAEFAPFRQSMLAIFCMVAWGGILLVLAAGNELLGLKQALLLVAGARMEPLLGAASLHSVDIAVVLAAFVFVIGAGYIHVSLGLALVLALRPWLDGYTYPTDNFYFLWAVLYLLGLWSVRQLIAPRALRGGLPLTLLGVFLLFGLLSLLQTIEVNATYREILHWAGYVPTFFLAIQGTPGPASRTIVLLGLLGGMLGQAIFAYPHLWYILPWLREYLQADPRRLAQWFQGATEFTPELARRFNLNRAFASMVFPNALAALLILGIPVAFACAWNGLTTIRTRKISDKPVVREFRYIVPWAVVLFVAVCLPLYLLGQLPLAYRAGTPPWFGSAQHLIYLSVGIASAVVTAFLFVSRKQGLARAAGMLACFAACGLVPILIGALWITYSRGAMLAVGLATLASLMIAPRGDFRSLWRALTERKAPLFLVIAVVSGAMVSSLVTAEGTGPLSPATTVTGKGMDISIGELADPGSMKLRLSYWRVALSVALDNSLTGVGLGNFRVAYGPYQYLGAGDVQNAHNVLLQTWCETGLPGAIALMAFWGTFLWRGARGIRAAGEPGHRRLLTGLYGGILAFLLHSMLDINFSHPSLVMMVMAAAGLFVSYMEEAGDHASSRIRPFALSLLGLAALAGGAAFRPYLFDLATNGGRFINVSNRSQNESREKAAQFLLSEGPSWASRGKPDPAPVLPLSDVITLLDDRETLFAVGRILVFDSSTKKMRALAKTSSLPPDALFQLARPWDARHFAFARAENWLREVERLDARFPYDPQVAWSLSGDYKLLVEQSTAEAPERTPQLLKEMVDWAEEAVRRSPLHKDMHQVLAWAHWTCGSHTTGPESLAHFEAALASFRRSRELGHNEPGYYFAYADALAALGESLQKAGRVEEGKGYSGESLRERAEGERVQKDRWGLGLQ